MIAYRLRRHVKGAANEIVLFDGLVSDELARKTEVTNFVYSIFDEYIRRF